MNVREWILLVTLSVLWGATFLFARVAVLEVAPLSLALARVALAAAVLGGGLAVAGGWPRGRRVWFAFLGMGLLNNAIPFSLIFWAQAHLPAGVAAIFNATTPFFTVVVAHFLTEEETATRVKVVGCLVAAAGVAIMLAPGGGAVAGVWPPAAAAALGGALSYGFASVFGRRFARLGVSATQSAFGQLAAATLILGVAAATIERPWTAPVPSGVAILSIVALAVPSTALAYVIFFRILATAGATNLMLVTLLIPVTAAGLGWLVLGERLGPEHFAGLALIGLGLVAIDGRALRRMGMASM